MMNVSELRTTFGRWLSLFLISVLLPLGVSAQSHKPETKEAKPKPPERHASAPPAAAPRVTTPPRNAPRENEARSNQSRARQSDERSVNRNATNGSETRGRGHQNNEVRGNTSPSYTAPGNATNGSEARGRGRQNNPVRGNTSPGYTAPGNATNGSDARGRGRQNNEVRGNTSPGYAPPGRESRGVDARGLNGHSGMVGRGRSVNRPDGSVHNFNDRGARTSIRTRDGAEGHFNSRGRLTSVRARGITINRGAHGERRFVTRRSDGTRLVGYGRDRGYVEHGYMRGGRPYVRRTYYSGGRSYAYSYRGAYWHGVAYYGYVPRYYYGRAFYGWAYNPWPAPIAWGWGWGGAPWYGYYGGYFAPAPVYATPALWLTDYLLAANLQAAYEARAAANASAQTAGAPDSAEADSAEADSEPADQSAAVANGPVTLTPEVKQAIADEVKAQIEAEQQEAANPNSPAASSDQLPAALDPAHRTFVVSTVLNPEMADGTECSLSPGDVLTRIQDTPDADQNVIVLVSSSQQGDCASGTQVPVAVQDLQDMQNDFRAKIDDGLNQMAENEGKNGMPGSPAAAKKASPDGQAQADLTVGADLKAQQDAARQAEQEVKQASSPGGGGND